MADFLENVGDILFRGYNETDIGDWADNEKFVKNLRYATKNDIKALNKTRKAEESNPSLNYVPVSFTTRDGGKQNGYLVRYQRQGKDKVFGLELDDGRSFNADGAKNFINNLRASGGGARMLVGGVKDTLNDVGVSTKSKELPRQGNAFPYRQGVVQALVNSRDARLEAEGRL